MGGVNSMIFSCLGLLGSEASPLLRFELRLSSLHNLVRLISRCLSCRSVEMVTQLYFVGRQEGYVNEHTEGV